MHPGGLRPPPRPWLVELRRVTAGALAFGVAGFLFDATAAALLLGTLAYLAWHLRQIYVTQQWLAHRKHRPLPRARGVWAPIATSLERLDRRSRKRKRRLRNFIGRFEQAAGAFPDAAVILRIDGGIVWMNAAAAPLLGLRSQDLNQPISNLIRNPAFVAYLEGERFETPLEMVSPVDDGMHVQVRVVPYGHDRHLMLARDLTRLKRLEQIRQDFVANVSHELRSPLTVIVGWLETLAHDEAAPERWRRPVSQMSQQSGRMCRIVEDLLKLSRIEGTPGAAGRLPVPVADLLESVQGDALGISEDSHRIRLEADRGARLLGDCNELYSAFSNLVFNAIQYTPDGGEIRLCWRREEEGACLEVEDTGIGIDERHLPRLTERFYRVDKARSREVGGTGLGLAIVKHVLMRHDATLEIRSRIDAGSTFTCRFPASRVVAGAEEAGARGAGPAAGPGNGAG